MKTKSIILTAVLTALIISIGYYFYQLGQKNAIKPIQNQITSYTNPLETQITPKGFKSYNDEKLSFEYPEILSLNNEDGVIKLSHALDYKHENFCDFKDGNSYLSKFTDFNLSLEMVKENTDDYLKKSEWPGFEYASKNPYRAGKLNGYKITEGIEGCGQTIYYFNIDNKDTIIAKHAYIPEFNSINNRRDEFLAIPNVITENKNSKFLSDIFATIKTK